MVPLGWGWQMISRRYAFGLPAHLIVGSFALLTLAVAGVAEDKAPIIVVEVKPPA
jgi:hypothetical protein